MQAVLVPLPETSSLILGSGRTETVRLRLCVWFSPAASSDVYEKSVAPLLVRRQLPGFV